MPLEAGAVAAPLFVPAFEARKLEKARGLAEAVIVDLEDAVPDARKDEARAWLATLSGPREGLWVRVNAADTGRCAADAAAAARVASVLVLPKCESAADVRLALEGADAGLEAGGGRGAPLAPIRLVPILETALGLEAAAEIARAAPGRIARLSLGLGDLSRDLGIPWQPEGPMAQHARCCLALASRAARLAPPLDTVYPVLGDEAGLAADVTRARAAGFGGKYCIHPNQLGAARAGFQPDEASLLLERHKVEAFAQAVREGRAAVVVEGHFVDYPVAELAEALLARAGRATGLLPGREAIQGRTPR